jgi:hypothetical protein
MTTPFFSSKPAKLPYSQPLIWVSSKALQERAKCGKALTKIICEKNQYFDKAKIRLALKISKRRFGGWKA